MTGVPHARPHFDTHALHRLEGARDAVMRHPGRRPSGREGVARRALGGTVSPEPARWIGRKRITADDRRVRQDLPTGTVTFLFTDVEGSTQLLHELGAELRGGARRASPAIGARRAAEGGVESTHRATASSLPFRAPGALAAAAALTEALAAGPVQVRVGSTPARPRDGRGLRRGRRAPRRPDRRSRPRRTGRRLRDDRSRSSTASSSSTSASTG